MRSILFLAIAVSSPPLLAAPSVTGEYLEARTCDVWTGPCFQNGEINTTGEMAVAAWSVRKGTWEGADLEGLSIAVAVRTEGTLSTPNEGKARAMVFIDRRAGKEQGKALLSLARKLAGKYLQDVVDVRRASISYRRRGEEAVLEVGDVARVRTRALMACCDVCCGNEAVAYPALSRTDRVLCAKSVEHAYSGPGLGARWSDPMKRSAMLGEFSL